MFKKRGGTDERAYRIAVGIVVGILSITVLTVALNAYFSRNARERELETPLVNVPPVDDRDHVTGDRRAPVQVIVYTNFSCPYCRAFHNTTMPNLLRIFGSDIMIAYRNYPLPRLPRSYDEAAAAECAARLGGEDTYWQFATALFSSPNKSGQDMPSLVAIAESVGLDGQSFETCVGGADVQAYVQAQRDSAAAAGITATPSIVIRRGANTVLIVGNWQARMEATIGAFLAQRRE